MVDVRLGVLHLIGNLRKWKYKELRIKNIYVIYNIVTNVKNIINAVFVKMDFIYIIISVLRDAHIIV